MGTEDIITVIIGAISGGILVKAVEPLITWKKFRGDAEVSHQQFINGQYHELLMILQKKVEELSLSAKASDDYYNDKYRTEREEAARVRRSLEACREKINQLQTQIHSKHPEVDQ